jgi:myosin heavy chain 9/10/11/14
MASQFLQRIQANAVNDALQQAQWAERKWVWVADKKEGFLQASIINQHGDEVELLFEDNTVLKD